FACANIVTSISYQIAVELLIWRRESDDVPVMPGKRLSDLRVSTPLVSILVPVHNRREHLPSCLRSALAQTRQDFEIVVVDNASTDGTWEVCQGFAKADPRVQIFRNPENIGPVRNWQRSFKYAQGHYGKLLFSDDLMEADYLEKTLPLLSDPHVAFVFSMAKIGAEPATAKAAYRFAPCTGKFSREHYIHRAL